MGPSVEWGQRPLDLRQCELQYPKDNSKVGVVVTPFLFWIVPRITFSLHPDPVVNSSGKVEMDPRIQHVLYASGLGFATLFFWIHNLQCRLESLTERREALKE